MKVKLDYFKASGKWYASGEYSTEMTYLYQVQSEVLWLKQNRALPGLVEADSRFSILITLEGGLKQMMYSSMEPDGLDDPDTTLGDPDTTLGSQALNPRDFDADEEPTWPNGV
jgi:hypothetical protein